MTTKWLVLRGVILVITLLLFAAVAGMAMNPQGKPQLDSPDSRDLRRMEALKDEIRHQLVTLPNYSVFDWLQAEVKTDGSVSLTGQVTRPSLKEDAEYRVSRIESATQVINQIEVLPISPKDDGIRLALYRALFRFDSPLFRYATQSVPPIHIIVKNGHVALKGVVHSQLDSQVAETYARGVSGIFEVRNELQIEQRLDQKVTAR